MKNVGRKFIVKRGDPATAIANVRTRTLSINREQIDVTDDDSSGWRELLDDIGQAEVNMTVEGVFSSHDIMEDALDTSTNVVASELELPDTATVDGDFALSSFELTGEYNGVATYSFELQSDGEISYTAAV